MPQGSVSVTFWQIEHRTVFSFSSMIALRERERVLGRDAQQVVRQPLRALRSDARQLVKLIDQARDGRGSGAVRLFHGPL